jgi:hypothetical protein
VPGHPDGEPVVAASPFAKNLAADEFLFLPSLHHLDAHGFSVTLVPHTRANVVFGSPSPGYRANLEVDVMAKYVERILGPRLEAIEARLRALET